MDISSKLSRFLCIAFTFDDYFVRRFTNVLKGNNINSLIPYLLGEFGIPSLFSQNQLFENYLNNQCSDAGVIVLPEHFKIDQQEPILREPIMQELQRSNEPNIRIGGTKKRLDLAFIAFIFLLFIRITCVIFLKLKVLFLDI